MPGFSLPAICPTGQSGLVICVEFYVQGQSVGANSFAMRCVSRRRCWPCWPLAN